jgi:hypothetical protein
MSKNDLLLTNHCDDNDVCTILGKCTVLDRSSEEGSDNTTWVSRFSAIMADGLIRVTANDEGFLCEGKAEKRKVGIIHRKEMHVSSLKDQKSASCSLMPDLVQIKGKGASHHAPVLWAICGLSSRSQQSAVVKSISKHLPKTFSPFAFQVGSFFLFVNECQNIWERQNKGYSAPWSQSVALNEYVFCNVSEEFDELDGMWSSMVQMCLSSYSF